MPKRGGNKRSDWWHHACTTHHIVNSILHFKLSLVGFNKCIIGLTIWWVVYNVINLPSCFPTFYGINPLPLFFRNFYILVRDLSYNGCFSWHDCCVRQFLFSHFLMVYACSFKVLQIIFSIMSSANTKCIMHPVIYISNRPKIIYWFRCCSTWIGG